MRSASRASVVAIAMAGTFLAIFAPEARATFHLWKIDEVYSNSTGTVQFIDFKQPSSEFDNESFVGGQSLTDSALGHTFMFPSDLPSTPVANQHFLVATPGYTGLPGLPHADYTLPVNGFFKTSGDTLTYAFGVNSLTFAGGQLPTDGVHALFRDYGGSELKTGVNDAINFAGQSGSVPEPGTLALLAGAAGLSLMRRRR